jgi:hypothetical protein
LLSFYAVIRSFYAGQTGSTSQQQQHVRTGPLLDVVISIKIDAHRATLAPGNCWRPQDSKNI